MIKEAVKFQGSAVFEGMTSIRSIIKGFDLGVNDRKITTVYFDNGRLHKIGKDIGYLKAVSEKYGFTVVESDAEEIEKMSLGTTHGGIIALAEERTIPCLTDNSDIPSDGFLCMIQGIEDPYNFGYSIRSLYACGCDGIILPERNWMSAAGVVARSSAGASELIPMYTADPLAAADILHARGYTIACADLRTDKLLGQCELSEPLLFIVGGEKRGISRALLDKADVLVKIPYANQFHASLSAASATTMVAYEVMRQRMLNQKK